MEGKLIMYYSDEIVEEVRQRNDIVDVINGYVSLKHKGSSYTACCPFHHEKTPSFHVNRDKQFYHCFGCGVGGNVFTFVMEYENFSFPEAVKFLADRAGMALPEVSMTGEDKKREEYKVTLKEMNRTAAGYFHYLMKHTEHGKKAYDYFRNRGLTDETIDSFALGYSDIYRDDLYRYLKNKGYTDSQLKNSGLVEISEKYGGTDKFWNRAMIPILDVNSKVIGFGGRVMGDGEPKYINTKETEVFDKSRNLFAMNIARRSKRKGIICCEGYMDVISMHQAGFDNAVASLGTAFTTGHANIIRRYTDSVYLAYDSDGAGVRATLKVIGILRDTGLSARVIDMSPYKDPDEFIGALGSEAFEERIEKAETGIMFEIRILSGQYNQRDPAEKTQFQNETAKCLSRIQDVLERNNYIDAVASQYMIDKSALYDKVKEYGVSEVYKTSGSYDYMDDRPKGENKNNEDYPAHKLMLTWLVNEPELFHSIDGIITENDFPEGIYRETATHIFGQLRNDGKAEPARIINAFETLESQRMAADILQTNLQMNFSPDRAGAVTDVVRKIRGASIKKQMSETKDAAVMQRLIKEKNEITNLNISLNNG